MALTILEYMVTAQAGPLDIDDENIIEESGSEGEEYEPGPADVESEDEGSASDASEVVDDSGKRKIGAKNGKSKPVKIGRQDIQAVRTNAAALKIPPAVQPDQR